MNLDKLFQSAVAELRRRKVSFAVAGGFAADLYRREPRLTMDVDLVIVSETRGVQTATEIIRSLGLQAGIAREADLAGGPLFAIRRKNTKPLMVIGRTKDDTSGEGVDILLPAIPWAGDAVTRAQSNQVDFGFGPVPVLTLEDVILSKLYALSSTRLRAKDIDDLQSIFHAGHTPDLPYLSGAMHRLHIVIPKEAAPFLPKTIVTLSRDVARTRRKR